MPNIKTSPEVLRRWATGANELRKNARLNGDTLEWWYADLAIILNALAAEKEAPSAAIDAVLRDAMASGVGIVRIAPEEFSARAEKAEDEVARLRAALAAIVARSENGELGTSRTRDMAGLARAALADTAAPAAPDSDGWIKWKGSTSPVPSGTVIEVEFRSGVRGIATARNWYWAHNNISSDIVAYRIVGARDE